MDSEAESRLKRHDRSMSVVAANVLAVPLFAVAVAVPTAGYALLWGRIPQDGFGRIMDLQWPILVAGIVASVIAHELLHGIGFRYAGNVAWREIRFGVHWRVLTPYASTASPMPVRAYRISIILPGLVLGMVPTCIAMAAGSEPLFWYGVFMLGTAAGDAIAWWTVRHVPAETIVMDSADRLGCVVVDGSSPPG